MTRLVSSSLVRRDHYKLIPDIRIKVLFALACALCLSSEANEPLLRATPESRQIDAVALAQAVDAGEGVDGLLGLVVVRDGYLVSERYYQDSEQSRRHVFSVTKSFMATLIGIAIDRAFIADIDAPMVDYLPYRLLPVSTGKEGITIRHLLTMTSGIQWNETVDWFAWSISNDHAGFILQRPLAHSPGTNFTYNTAASHLLSVVLTEATGLSSADFADAYLLHPLGISSRRWWIDSHGIEFGGHGLWLRTEDIAKLGVLYLNAGRWNGEQIVPASWVAQGATSRVELNGSFGPLRSIDYGFLWWLDSGLDYSIFTAWGFAGQYVFCVPSLNLVIATASDGNVGWNEANDQEEQVLELIVNRILPTVRERQLIPQAEPSPSIDNRARRFWSPRIDTP
jgi:CubicO group peptidase (beta-lactamase class C family)